MFESVLELKKRLLPRMLVGSAKDCDGAEPVIPKVRYTGDPVGFGEGAVFDTMTPSSELQVPAPERIARSFILKVKAMKTHLLQGQILKGVVKMVVVETCTIFT